MLQYRTLQQHHILLQRHTLQLRHTLQQHRTPRQRRILPPHRVAPHAAVRPVNTDKPLLSGFFTFGKPRSFIMVRGFSFLGECGSHAILNTEDGSPFS